MLLTGESNIGVKGIKYLVKAYIPNLEVLWLSKINEIQVNAILGRQGLAFWQRQIGGFLKKLISVMIFLFRQ